MVLERIKELCIANGISQRKLEEELGLGNGASSKWVKSSPSGDVLQKIADRFDVSVDYLLGRESDFTSQKWDDETVEFMETMRNRPDIRIMFSASKHAKREHVEAATAVLNTLKGSSEN